MRGYEYTHETIERDLDCGLHFEADVTWKQWVDDEPHPAYNTTGPRVLAEWEVSTAWCDGENVRYDAPWMLERVEAYLKDEA